MLHYLNQHLAPLPQNVAGRALIENVSRRSFLKGTAAGGGLVVAMQLLPFNAAEAFETYDHGGHAMPHGVVMNPHLFVSIDPDGTVNIVTIRSEMGTGARTSLPMVIADEMEADWSKVKLIQAEGDEPKYGNQDTDGSRSMRHHIQVCRQMGASVRYMLRQAAAEQWGVPMAEVQAVNHEVIHEGSGNRAGYGDIGQAAMELDAPSLDISDNPALEPITYKDESEFRYIGKGEVQIYDLHDITTGKAIYGADVHLDGMKYAVVARPPVVGGKVKSVDDSAALAVPGVEQVIQLEGHTMPAKFLPLGGVAVVAANTHAALKGREALTIEWDDGPHAVYNSGAYMEEMKATAEQPGKAIRTQGDVDGAMSSAAKTFAQTYTQDHMAHIAMEPPAAIANYADGKLEVWAPVQSPYGTRQDVAEYSGVPIEDVRVNVTLLGGGFGRKSKCDFVHEAAKLSMEVGAPVRVQWTREDDVQHSFYHTASAERIEVALDADNKPTAWLHRSVAPSILSTFAEDSGYQFFIEYGMGFADMPFEIPNIRAENGQAMAHTRIGWFRSVSNIPRAWAVQSFAAELANELGRDEKEVLLELIGSPRIIDPKATGMPEDLWNYGDPYDVFPNDTGRLANVVELACEKAGWGKELPEGEGLGLAVHRSFLTYVAAVCHVKVEEDGTVRVPETHMAVDCGFPANPERIESQMQGAAVQGMTVALHSGITFKDGRAEQSNFTDYDVVRIDNFPENVFVHVVPHKFETHATGVGEPGVPPIAPAIANGIFNATGKRIRHIPIRPEDIRDA